MRFLCVVGASGFEVVKRRGCAAQQLGQVRGGLFWVGGGGVLGITRGDRRWSESMETNRDGVWSSSGEDALQVVEAVGLEFFVFDFGRLSFDQTDGLRGYWFDGVLVTPLMILYFFFIS